MNSTFNTIGKTTRATNFNPTVINMQVHCISTITSSESIISIHTSEESTKESDLIIKSQNRHQ